MLQRRNLGRSEKHRELGKMGWVLGGGHENVGGQRKNAARKGQLSEMAQRNFKGPAPLGFRVGRGLKLSRGGTPELLAQTRPLPRS